jgi:hypothetical protein
METKHASGAACPISAQKVNSSAARVNGVIVTGLLAVALFTPAKWVLALLAIDFAIKVFARFRYSPICALSRLVARTLRLPTHPVDAAPKRFAAALGLVFSLTGIVLGPFAGLWAAYAVVIGSFSVCAALEGFGGVCVGCLIYQAITSRMSRRARVSSETV